jgi:hypothetical protein
LRGDDPVEVEALIVRDDDLLHPDGPGRFLKGKSALSLGDESVILIRKGEMYF